MLDGKKKIKMNVVVNVTGEMNIWPWLDIISLDARKISVAVMAAKFHQAQATANHHKLLWFL